MKKILFAISAIALFSCNNSSDSKTIPNENTSAIVEPSQQYVTAMIDGKAWKSEPEEVLASYSEFDDKLQIFTKDASGKANFLISILPFSKVGIGSYSSVREGVGGFGISLLDDNSSDSEEWDYDNFRQAATTNCIAVTSINETSEGKMLIGTFASPMNVSNNYDANKSKSIVITEGKFAVLLKK